MAQPLKNLLGDAVKRYGISKGVQAAVVSEEFIKICRELYGKKVLDDIKHVSFRNGQLKIKCGQPAVAQNLIINRARIINEINQKIGNKAVADLRALVF